MLAFTSSPSPALLSSSPDSPSPSSLCLLSLAVLLLLLLKAGLPRLHVSVSVCVHLCMHMCVSACVCVGRCQGVWESGIPLPPSAKQPCCIAGCSLFSLCLHGDGSSCSILGLGLAVPAASPPVCPPIRLPSHGSCQLFTLPLPTGPARLGARKCVY